MAISSTPQHMDSRTAHPASDSAKEIILEDYRHRSALLIESEKAGETRVNLFITLVVLVVGGSVSLVTSQHESAGRSVRLTVLCALAALLGFGWLTLLRLIKRNRSTDECKHALDTIRQMFKDHFDGTGVLQGYYAVNWPHARAGKEEHQKAEKIGSAIDWKKELRGFGGLADLVAAINAVLAGVVLFAAFALCGDWALPWGGFAGICGFVLAFMWQFRHVRSKEHEHGLQMAALRPTHAGGVVYKQEGNGTVYLLVRTTSGADEWVLPKGHVERGEGHGECAVREVIEETGALVSIRQLLGEWRFAQGDQEVRMKGYLMQWEDDCGPGDGRGKSWMTIDEAWARATHPETKEILREVARRNKAIRAAEGLKSVFSPVEQVPGSDAATCAPGPL